MSYINTSERIKHFTLDLKVELSIIHKIINSLKASYEKNDYSSKYIYFSLRGNTLSLNEFLNTFYYNKLSKHYENYTEENDYLLASDILLNLLNFFDTNVSLGFDTFKMALDRNRLVLSMLGYKPFYDEDSGIFNIIELNPLAEQVANETDDINLKQNIYDFLVYNISNKSKEVIISDMYKHFEDLDFTGQAGNILSALLNNGIRHDKKKMTNPLIKPYIKENQDTVYDDAFNLLIESFYHQKNKNIIKTIEDLNKQNSKTKSKNEKVDK